MSCRTHSLRACARASAPYKPDALLIGEVWEDASNKIAYDQRRRYFTDRQLDSVMNYPWQKAILRYVRGEDDGTGSATPSVRLRRITRPDVLQTVMNILSTHDTPRAINALLDSRDGDRTDLAHGISRRSSCARAGSGSSWQRFCSSCCRACPASTTATKPG